MAHPPLHVPDEVWQLRWATDLNRAFDDEGRPLNEATARAEGTAAGVPMEMRRCPYPDSRLGKEMNVSGLGHMSRHWDGLVGALAQVRDRQLARRRRERAGLEDCLLISAQGAALATYLFHRPRDRFENGALPGLVASLYKASVGFVQTYSLICAGRMAGGSYAPGAEVSAEEVYDFADRTGIFMNPGLACAGSPRQIVDLLQVLQRPASPATSGSALDGLVADWPQFDRFADLKAKALLLTGAFRVRMVQTLLGPPDLRGGEPPPDAEVDSAERQKEVFLRAFGEPQACVRGLLALGEAIARVDPSGGRPRVTQPRPPGNPPAALEDRLPGPLGGALLGYLRWERAYLEDLDELRAQICACMGLPAPSGAIDFESVRESATPGDALARQLGVEAHRTSRRTTLRVGGSELEW